MSVYEKISGFADEISQDFDQQLKTVTDLGMKYICIRSAEHKGIADYTPEEVRTVLLPKLRAAGVGVSSLGTAIGKVEVDDLRNGQAAGLLLHPDVQLPHPQGCRCRRLYRCGAG